MLTYISKYQNLSIGCMARFREIYEHVHFVKNPFTGVRAHYELLAQTFIGLIFLRP